MDRSSKAGGSGYAGRIKYAKITSATLQGGGKERSRPSQGSLEGAPCEYITSMFTSLCGSRSKEGDVYITNTRRARRHVRVPSSKKPLLPPESDSPPGDSEGEAPTEGERLLGRVFIGDDPSSENDDTSPDFSSKGKTWSYRQARERKPNFKYRKLDVPEDEESEQDDSDVLVSEKLKTGEIPTVTSDDEPVVTDSKDGEARAMVANAIPPPTPPRRNTPWGLRICSDRDTGVYFDSVCRVLLEVGKSVKSSCPPIVESLVPLVRQQAHPKVENSHALASLMEAGEHNCAETCVPRMFGSWFYSNVHDESVPLCHREERLDYFTDLFVKQMVKRFPAKPNVGDIVGKLRLCPQCEIPSWGALFEVKEDGDMAYCEHDDGVNSRVILYSDPSLPQSVCLVGARGNLLQITKGRPNFKRTETVFHLTVPLEGRGVTPSWLKGRFVNSLSVINGRWRDVICVANRFGHLKVDISFILWYTALAGASSPEGFRRNLRSFIHDGEGDAVFWDVEALNLGFSYWLYNESMMESSKCLNKGDWESFKILDSSLALFPLQSGVPAWGPSNIEIASIPPPVIHASEAVINPESELRETIEEARNLLPKLKELAEQMECEDKPPENEPVEILDDKLSFLPGEVPKTPGCHTVAGEQSPPIPEGVGNVVVKKVKPEEFKVKRESGVIHHQCFGDKTVHFPNDSVNQTHALICRYEQHVPRAEPTCRFKGKQVRRMSKQQIADRKFWRLFKILPDEELEFNDLWSLEGYDQVEALIKHMGKSGSRNRMFKLFRKVLDCDESAFDEVFKVFTKSDEKQAKDKPRLILYVPALMWLKLVCKVDAIVRKFKAVKCWKDNATGTYYVWACGMTQRELSKQATEAAARVPANTVFICGDDNTDKDGDADCKKYDSTQRGFFADCQWQVLQELGITAEEVGEMRKYHRGERVANGFSYTQKRESLPTGALWTLMMNSIGLIVQQIQKDAVRAYFKKSDLKYSYEDLIHVTTKLLGLSMTYNLAPTLMNEPYNGSEFLKGIFVKGAKQYYWVPLPSRLNKWSARIYDSKQGLSNMEKNWKEHLRAVADGQRDAILDPLCRIWVDYWSKQGGKRGKLQWEWRNVTYNEFRLDPEDEANWISIWEPIMESRYGITRERYAEMRQLLAAHAGEAGTFTGSAFSAVWRRDYLGSVT